MKVIDWNRFAEHGIDTDEPVSFTTGVFDGLHRGHHQLINCLTTRPDTIPVLATFTTNPFRLLRPDSYRGDIASLTQKIELLDAAGIGILILIDFSLEFSKLSGRDFFAYIRKHLHLSHLVLGKDHKLGNRGDTTALQAKEMLKPDGVVVDIVEPLFDGELPVSSTRIRKAVESADINEAERLRGRKHVLDIYDIGFIEENNSPYLRRNDIKQVIPFTGGYAVTLANGDKTFATKMKFIEDRLVFENTPGFQAKTLTFNCLLQE